MWNESRSAVGDSRWFKIEYLICPLFILIVILVVATFTGLWITDENPYRSYSLQAEAWLDGRLDLGKDYPWLELAIFNGKYYVSFPPFPSFVLLPFAMFWGNQTPDNFISLLFTIISVLYAMRLYEKLRGSLKRIKLYILFLFLGNGYLFISIQGWVWFFAQSICFALTLMSLYYALEGKGGIALACWACAVGCRPMMIVYIPVLVILLLENTESLSGSLSRVVLVKEKWYWMILPILLSITYLYLNYARFENPVEFGHNYLPEFQRTVEGQFSFSYFKKNLMMLFRIPPIDEEGKLLYYKYDCMAFWMVNPMIVSFIFAMINSFCVRKKICLCNIVLLAAILMHLAIILCHRTMGGYQFGNRYIVDILPFVYWGTLKIMPEREGWHVTNELLFIMGFSINLIGTVAAFNHWI